jgi:hypothetical protein
MNPLARRSDLSAENLPEEVILYDKSNNKVHWLSKTAAAIWESSDGTRSVDNLAQIVEKELGAPADREMVVLALEQLEKADPLEAGSGIVPDAALTSRREAVSKIAMASTALVATIAAPSTAAHSSHTSTVPPPKG